MSASRSRVARRAWVSVVPILTLVVLVTLVPGAHAATRTWTGNSDGTTWSNDTNWSGDTLPVDGDDIIIPGVYAGEAVAIVNVPDIELASLTIQPSPTGIAAPSLTGSGGVLDADTYNVQGGTFADLTVRVAGTGVFSSNVDGDGVTFVDGASLNIASGGALTLASESSLTSSGEIVLQDGASIAGPATSSIQILEGGKLFVDEDAAAIVNAPITNVGEISLAAGSTLTGGMSAGIVQSDNTGEFGSSTIYLDGASIVNTPLTINGGRLMGAGDVTGASATTIGDGGTLIPQNIADSAGSSATGILNVPSLALASGSNVVTINRGAGAAGAANGFSQVVAAGAVTIANGANLTEQPIATPVTGTSFTPITGGSVSGTTTATIDDSLLETGSIPDGLYAYATTGSTSVEVEHRTAVITVAPASLFPGDTLTVTGTGFAPGESVEVGAGVSYGQSGDEIVKPVTVLASTNGTYSVPLVIPESAVPTDAGHAYLVRASGLKSNAFPFATFTVVARPVVVTPPTTKDTDGDGLLDTVDCAPLDKTKPAVGPGVVDKDCNGLNDAIQPKFVIGTKANDVLVGGGGNDVMSGGAGNDRISGGGGNDRLNGGDGDDRLSGGFGDDRLSGGRGNDRLAGGFGNDRLAGGMSNDVLDGGTGNDLMDGGTGTDKLAGGLGSDKIKGGPGSDTIVGGPGKDTVNGGPGNDRIVAGDGLVDKITCGTGYDIVTADKDDKVAKDCEVVRRR